jgi:hypothetical protein
MEVMLETNYYGDFAVRSSPGDEQLDVNDPYEFSLMKDIDTIDTDDLIGKWDEIGKEHQQIMSNRESARRSYLHKVHAQNVLEKADGDLHEQLLRARNLTDIACYCQANPDEPLRAGFVASLIARQNASLLAMVPPRKKRKTAARHAFVNAPEPESAASSPAIRSPSDASMQSYAPTVSKHQAGGQQSTPGRSAEESPSIQFHVPSAIARACGNSTQSEPVTRPAPDRPPLSNRSAPEIFKEQREEAKAQRKELEAKMEQLRTEFEQQRQAMEAKMEQQQAALRAELTAPPPAPAITPEQLTTPQSTPADSKHGASTSSLELPNYTFNDGQREGDTGPYEFSLMKKDIDTVDTDDLIAKWDEIGKERQQIMSNRESDRRSYLRKVHAQNVLEKANGDLHEQLLRVKNITDIARYCQAHPNDALAPGFIKALMVRQNAPRPTMVPVRKKRKSAQREGHCAVPAMIDTLELHYRPTETNAVDLSSSGQNLPTAFVQPWRTSVEAVTHRKPQGSWHTSRGPPATATKFLQPAVLAAPALVATRPEQRVTAVATLSTVQPLEGHFQKHMTIENMRAASLTGPAGYPYEPPYPSTSPHIACMIDPRARLNMLIQKQYGPYSSGPCALR